MRIGLALPHYDFSAPDRQPVTWPGLLDAASRAERLGFGSIWISDHFFLGLARYGGPQDLQGTPEAFTALAAMAARTDRARLGTLVACAPFRHPAIVAKMATAIDLISGGRFDLGLGAGWYEHEFRAFGYPYGTVGSRFSILEDHVEAIAALLAGDRSVTLERRFVKLDDAYNSPPPVQPGGPPVWLGGKGGDRLLRLAAATGAGWNTVWRWTTEALADRVKTMRALFEEAGRDPGSARVSVGLLAVVGEDQRDLEARLETVRRWAPGSSGASLSLEELADETLTGTVDACVTRLAGLADLGVEEVIVSPSAPLPFGVADWSMVDLIADRLIPEAAGL